MASLGKPERSEEKQEHVKSLLPADEGSDRRQFREMRWSEDTDAEVNNHDGTQADNEIKSDVKRYIQYREERKKKTKYFSEKILEIKKEQAEELKKLSERQREDREAKLSGSWRGRGKARNALRSLIAFENALERQNLKEQQFLRLKKMRQEKRAAIGAYVPSFRAWLTMSNKKQVEAWRYARNQECLIVPEELPENETFILAGIAAFTFYSVAQNGFVYYSLAEGYSPSFVDTGKALTIYNETDYDSVLAAMQLAVKKWGKIKISGSEEFKKVCISIALEKGIYIVNPELQDMLTKNKFKINEEDMRNEQKEFMAYHKAVNADIYRVTCIKMFEDGNKKTFILAKEEGESRGFTAEQVISHIPEMLNLQKRGENIYINPLSNDKHHILIDDMNIESLKKLTDDGYKPAILIESSSGNYQTVITIPKLKTAFDRDVGNRITERLNKSYGDKNLFGCVHPHRAPGFENRKAKYKSTDGVYPKVKLMKSESLECEKALALSLEINAEYEAYEKNKKKLPQKERFFAGTGRPLNAYYRHLDNIENHISISDNSRVDAMIAVRMRATGHTREAVVEAIMACAKQWREETENRNWQRYAERTADYAFGIAGDRDLQRWKGYIVGPEKRINILKYLAKESKILYLFEQKMHCILQKTGRNAQGSALALQMSSRRKQGHFLYQDLLEQLNPRDTLLLLAKHIPWDSFERAFAPLYYGMAAFAQAVGEPER
jgi:hypothetical protein